MSAGVAIGIILGQELGAGKTDTAKDHAIKYITFAVMISVVIGVLFAIAAEFIPELYDIDSPATKLLATRMMQISALCFPLGAFANACYFTLRSGGKMSVTIIFDSGFIWCILVPVAFVLCRYTHLTIIPIFAICQGLDIVKCLIGGYFFNKGDWIKKIVN
jgi:Na+-driven multidrug efflux pump